MTKAQKHQITAALDRLVKRHREYYDGWLKAWLKAASKKEQ